MRKGGKEWQISPNEKLLIEREKKDTVRQKKKEKKEKKGGDLGPFKKPRFYKRRPERTEGSHRYMMCRAGAEQKERAERNKRRGKEEGE